METSILNSTERYAACALFALALNQSQRHQYRLTSTLPSLNDEPLGQGMTAADAASVTDRPYLWIHQDSGLLLPVFRFMNVDDKAWDGLKETAGSSSQIRHHVGAFLKLLSDEGVPTSESVDKELALLKAVDAMLLSMEASDSTTSGSEEKLDYGQRSYEKYCNPSTESDCGAGIVHTENTERTNLDTPVKDETYSNANQTKPNKTNPHT